MANQTNQNVKTIWKIIFTSLYGRRTVLLAPVKDFSIEIPRGEIRLKPKYQMHFNSNSALSVPNDYN